MIEQLVLFFLKDALFALGFMARGNAFPQPLSREEEARMLERMVQGDDEARAALIEHNLRLVAYIVKKHYAESREQDDLISIGTIGLIRAAETFKSDKAINFSTYASKCIDNTITHLWKRCISTDIMCVRVIIVRLRA